VNNSAAHSELVNAIAVALSREGVMIWKNATGMARSVTGALIRFGLPGSSDLFAVLPPNGRFLAIECKTGAGKPKKNQDKFAAAIARHGGIYVVARSVQDALDAVEHERQRCANFPIYTQPRTEQ
jgi:hypothetical protein